MTKLENSISLKDFDDIPSISKSDRVFTPLRTAEKIVKIFNPEGRILEPCKGAGAFLKFLPQDADWCEITEGKDFFNYNKKVDWIITNPPYSLFTQFLKHSFELADNVVFLVPLIKPIGSWERMDIIFGYGGIVSIHCIPAKECGFTFGYPFGVYYFKRGYKGKTKFERLK